MFRLSRSRCAMRPRVLPAPSRPLAPLALLPLLSSLALLLVAAAPLAAHQTRPAAPTADAAQASGEQLTDDFIRLGDDVRPRFQAIDLTLDADRADYSGSTIVDLEVVRATDTFRFHSEGLTLERVELRRPDGELVPIEHTVGTEVVTARVDAPLAPGRGYRLEIDFTNQYDTQAVSLYKAEVDGDGYLFTQFQADDAREAFPLWDEPGFKFPYQLTLRVPEGHQAFTNTPQLRETVEDGWRTIVFQRTKPLPSYLLAIVTGPLETVEVEGLGFPARIITAKGQSHLAQMAAEVTPPMLHYLEDYFGLPYPYEKLDQVAVPEFWPGGMENAGLILYADQVLLLDPETATVGDRRSMTRVVAHELAHMWFGDLVTMQWWDDLWLNESFATWMETRVNEDLYPELGVAAAAADSAQGIMGFDTRTTTQPIRRPVGSGKELLSGIGVTYVKGRAVLAMFERWLGEEAFREGVVRYMRRHAWGNATSDDLWKALDEASGKPVSAAMTTFLEQAGVPRVEVEPLEGGKVRLRQSRFLNYGAEAPAQTWKVPVGMRFPVAGGAVGEASFLLEGPEAVVDLGVDETPTWIFPNRDGDGYYRWTLPAASMTALGEVASEALNPRERIALLGNTSALMLSGDLDGGTYLSVVGSLLADPDPMVVRSAIDELGSVRQAFVPADLEDEWAAYVRDVLRPATERFGLDARAGEEEAVSLLRSDLFLWLGREGRDPAVLARADELARAFLEDPTSVEPALASIAIRLAAIEGDEELWTTYKTRAEAAETPAQREIFLSSLGAFEDPALRRKTMAYSLEGPLRPNEMFQPLFGLFGDRDGRELIFQFILDNYDMLMTRLPPAVAPMMPQIAGGCSAERLEKATAFFGDPERDLPGVSSSMARVTESVSDCLKLREREGEAVARYLERAAG